MEPTKPVSSQSRSVLFRLLFAVSWVTVCLFASVALFAIGYAVLGAVIGGAFVLGLLMLAQYPLMRIAAARIENRDEK